MKRVFVAVTLAGLCGAAQAQSKDMSFFVTSAGPGKGADLGGAEGRGPALPGARQGGGRGRARPGAPTSARARRPTRATASARARGATPRAWWWRKNVDELHGNPNLNKQTALTEKGEVVNGRGDTPNMHDILTGSTPEGARVPGRQGHDLRQLDQERRGLGDGRPPRPHRPATRARRRSPGTRRTRRAAAARMRSRAPAATASSTASPRTERLGRKQAKQRGAVALQLLRADAGDGGQVVHVARAAAAIAASVAS